MKDDKKDYQTDDHRTQQPEFTIPVEDVQVQFYNLNVGENKGKIVDEYTYAQFVDPIFAKNRLERHVSSIILQDMSQHNLCTGIGMNSINKVISKH